MLSGRKGGRAMESKTEEGDEGKESRQARKNDKGCERRRERGRAVKEGNEY